MQVPTGKLSTRCGCNLHGETMPELRSGTRQGRAKSKRVDDTPQPQPIEQAANFALPANNRTGRRVGVGRGRGNGAAVANGPAAAKVRTIGGRGSGIRVIDLDPDRPCEVLPGAPIQIAQDPIANQAAVHPADKIVVMEGGSPDKVVAAEEEATTAPIPDRV